MAFPHSRPESDKTGIWLLDSNIPYLTVSYAAVYSALFGATYYLKKSC